MPETELPDWAERLPDLSDEVNRRRFSWVIGLLLVVGFAAFLAVGGNEPADPVLDASTSASTFEGFEQVGFRLRPSPSHPNLDELAGAERCALLADTPKLRQQGLMGVTDLRGYEGMIFEFAEEVVGGFHMENTPMPLSIAFFDAAGGFVSAADMAPCEAGTDCPSYQAEGPFQYALEVPQGKLADLGAGPGSRLLVGGVCAAGQPTPG